MLAPIALAALLALAGGAARSAVAAGSQVPPAVPGELIVGFERGSSQSEQNAAVSQVGGARAQSFSQIRAVLIRVPPQLTGLATKLLLGHPRVLYVEPNHVVRATETTPDDPSFGQLWGLSNTGQTGGTPDADIDAPEAWDLSTGSSSVVVGVTDTGVDFSHPDLAAQQWVNPGENCGSSDPAAPCAERTDGVDNDGNTYVDDWRGWDWVNDDNDPVDDHNHGTHVSGTIGAVGNNATGVTGVNWNVKVMALKFLDSTGYGTTADAVAATLYAADRGAHVSSNSWGGGPFDQSLLDAIEYGAARGMLFVAAAGNDSRNNDVTPTYPSSYPSEAIVSVAATDHNDALAFFSSYGAKSVDLAAPGVNILSTTRGNTYQSFSGTSMATPHVAGVAALLKARYPDASLYGLKALLLRSVDPAGALAGTTATGGRLNAFNAASCDADPKVWLGAPSTNFLAGVGDTLQVSVLGSSCAEPAGLGNVGVTVNGSPVALAAATPDRGLYTGSYTVVSEGTLTVTATVAAGGDTATHTATGAAFHNYTCSDVPLAWVDVTPGTRLTGAGSDDSFSTLGIGFPVTYFGQSYSTAYVSSNGFLTLGSSAGATTPLNAAIPTTATPNGVVAPFWDDLNPAAGGAVYAGVSGVSPNRTLHIEWFNVPHFTFSGSGTVTFELSLKENGDVRYQYLDTDFGNASWNAGASATAGVERADGVVGRQLSFNQPQLTNGRAVSCTFGSTPPPVPTITTTSLPGSTVGTAYSATLAATGGTPGYTWSVSSGALPAGLTLNTATGAITGTPTTAGTATFTARVTDSLAQSDTQDLSIVVAPPPAPTITTTSLPGGTVGTAYSATIEATGGTPPYTWSVVGSLPAGLTLNSTTGAVTGTPTSAGTASFTAQVTDSLVQGDTQDLSLTVAPPPVPTVTTTSLPGGTVGTAYSQTLQATGGTPPYTWSLDSGSLPAGLTLNTSTGALTGTPTSAGPTSFTVRVTDSLAQTDDQDLSIAVAPPPVPTITTTSLPAAMVGVAYSQTLQATGGTPPYTWSVSAGALPAGVTLNTSTGALTGTPTTAGTASFTAQVADNLSQTDTQPLSIAVSGPTDVTAWPSATTVLSGSLRSGSAANLAADDDSYYEVDSTTSGTRTSDWYGVFTGVTNSLSNLRVSYKGKNSRSCTQVIFIWRWSSSSWTQLDSRTVGTSEVSVANRAPSGTLANYVSGTTGDGEVRVRVRCRRSSSGSFFSSADLLQISYVRP